MIKTLKPQITGVLKRTLKLYLHGARHRSWPRSSTIISSALKIDEFSFNDKNKHRQTTRFICNMHFSLIILIGKSDESEPKNWEFCQENVEHVGFQRPEVTIPR